MKRLCCDRDPASCEALRSILAENGIECVVEDARDTPLFEDRDAAEPTTLPELWVVDDQQFEKAWSILNRPPDPVDEPPHAEDDPPDS